LQGEIEWFELLLESLTVTFELLMLSEEQTKPDPLQLLAMELSLMLLAHWVSCAHPACKLDKKASVSQAIGQCSQHGTHDGKEEAAVSRHSHSPPSILHMSLQFHLYLRSL
jgi:hypothetical protein